MIISAHFKQKHQHFWADVVTSAKVLILIPGQLQTEKFRPRVHSTLDSLTPPLTFSMWLLSSTLLLYRTGTKALDPSINLPSPRPKPSPPPAIFGQQHFPSFQVMSWLPLLLMLLSELGNVSENSLSLAQSCPCALYTSAQGARRLGTLTF